MNDQSRTAPGAETRERILESAASLFHEQGFAATGIATVLQAAGVNSGSLYHFFPGKEALLIGVLERHIAVLAPRILDPVEGSTEDPMGRVHALVDLYRRDLLMSGNRRGCPVGNLALEVGDGLPAARLLIDRYFGLWTSAVRGWLEKAGDRLPADLDREMLAQHVLSLVQGGLMLARAAGDIGPYDATVGQLRSNLELLEDRAKREGTEKPDALPTALEDGNAGLERPEWRTW